MAVVQGIDAIETSFVTDYGTNVEELVQQKGSLLRPHVRIENFTGKGAAFIEQFGQVEAVLRTNRHADTPLNPTPYDRRWAFPHDLEIGELVDKQDLLRMLIDPISPIAMLHAFALGRSMDDEIIRAILSPNQTGEDGQTTVPLPPEQVIDFATGVGMTVEYLRAVRKRMLEANVQLGMGMETITAVITPAQHDQLLAQTETTNSDYNTTRTLVNGEIDTFLGMNFVISNRTLGGVDYNGALTPVDPDAESAIFFTNTGVGLGIWDDIEARVSERDDKSYATQIYAKSTFGATRLQEPKVVIVETDKTVGEV